VDFILIVTGISAIVNPSVALGWATWGLGFEEFLFLCY
jgi:hypothetical protein